MIEEAIAHVGNASFQSIQKYINKCIPVSLDLFGVDRSSSAHWFCVWGLKARYDEPAAKTEVNPNAYMSTAANSTTRGASSVEMINKTVSARQPLLYMPDFKFNRLIGEHARKPYSVHGELLSETTYAKHPKSSPSKNSGSRRKLHPIIRYNISL